MSDERKRESPPWERLIAAESRAALERFRRRDFRAILEQRLRENPPRRRPVRLLAMAAMAILIAAVGIGFLASHLAMKRDIRELKEILLRLPELRIPLADLSPASVEGEEMQRILLSWVFRLAGERLSPTAGTEAEWRATLERASAAAAAPAAVERRPRGLSEAEQRLLEKKIRALIIAGELQRRRERNTTDML